MIYTMIEIVLFIGLGATLGFLAGWFLQRSRRFGSDGWGPLHRFPTSPNSHYPPITAPEQVDLGAIEAEEHATLKAARAAVLERMQRRALPASSDDLTQVRGIGPVISNLLYEMGVTSFEQIAAFTEEDIELVGAALGSLAGRIRRDNWVESARQLEEARQSSEA